MSKLVVSEFVSLDGVMQDPAWTAPYWNDDIARLKYHELFASGALLLGRRTYETFAASWPIREHAEAMNGMFSALPHPGAFSERMNNIPKLVASNTSPTLEWTNSTLVTGNLVEEVVKLKRHPGQDILVVGSASVAHTLMRHHLVDEYHLLVYPVLVGRGMRLFHDGASGTLELVGSRTLGPSVVHLHYRARSPAAPVVVA